MSTTNNDVGIPTNIKDVDIPKNEYINIPQHENMNITSNNNNQLSVSVKIHLNKESTQIFNSVTVIDHVSTTNNDVSIPTKKM